ncbi:MAG: EamA family transporter [Bacteroidales bacterium]|nr:EamA family transporter [Bacteroidales bacterium]MBD5258528.1 EamA family transporter [Barnesiella sp.]
MNQSVKSNLWKGYLLAAIAEITYGMNPLFAVPLYEDDGMNPDSVVLFRYLLALPIIAVMVLMRGRRLTLPRYAVIPSVGLGLLMAASSLTLFLSYLYMNVGIASTLLFVYPIIVALIMVIFFKERISMRLIGCIVVSLCGIALLYKGSDGDTLDPTGTLFVALSALTYAIYLVGMNHKRIQNVPTLQLTFYMLLFGSLLFVVRLLSGVELTLPKVWYHWGNLIGLAVFPTAISFICTTRAIQIIGPMPTAILGALEPASAIFFGVTILGQSITPRDFLGLMLIVAAVTVVIAGSHITGTLIRVRKMFPRLPFRPKKK